MTLDGHLKSGLAASLLASVLIPHYAPIIPIEALPFVILSFFMGNIAPDFMEFRLINLIQHRTHTHYPWYYVIFIAILIGLAGAGMIPQENWFYVGIAFFAGCLAHIICDIPYGGIPYIFPTRKITLMRIPFDSIFNRFVEHCVVIALVLTYALWDFDFAGLSLLESGSLDTFFSPTSESPPILPDS